MSRIGKQPVPVPSGVEVSIEEGLLRVKGPKGELAQHIPGGMGVTRDGDEIRVERSSDQPRDRALHGLTRTLVANAIQGVTEGFRKTLEIVGVGYRAEKKPFGLTLSLGYSHTIDYPAPEGIELTAPSPTVIEVSGASKERVGQVAAEIRAMRPPEPYKGKGVRYRGEAVRRKAGKTGA